MAIRDHSPHLASVLNRYKIPTQLLDPIFDLAINLGGLDEQDFTRTEGSSYNPRPARLGLILVDNAKATNPLAIAVGMMACVGSDVGRFSERLSDLAPNIRDQLLSLLNEASIPIASWAEESLGLEARTISLAVLLDRARHAHLSELAIRLELLEQIKTEMELGLRYAEDLEPKLWQLLKSWCDRYSMLAIQNQKLRANQ